MWVKSVAYERQFGNVEQALDLVIQGLERYPKCAKLWMMKGQRLIPCLLQLLL